MLKEVFQYEKNDFGTYDDLDAIMPAFAFEIIDTNQKTKINWNTFHLGKIQFNDIDYKGVV